MTKYRGSVDYINDYENRFPGDILFTCDTIWHSNGHIKLHEKGEMGLFLGFSVDMRFGYYLTHLGVDKYGHSCFIPRYAQI